MGETEGVGAWAARQAARQQHLLAWLRAAPQRWAARKAALEATGAEFVYSESAGGESPTSSTAHRVVRKTATRLYVEYRGFSAERDLVGGLPEGTHVLDRAALERDGRASPRRRAGAYSSRPYEDTPRWSEEVDARIRRCRERLHPEAWIEDRRRVDAYLARPRTPQG
jgi:hypothetical protein